MSLKEQIARSIYRDVYRNLGDPDEQFDALNDIDRAILMTAANAALKGMVQPTEEMIKAGSIEFAGARSLPASDFKFFEPHTKLTWAAMIGAALREAQPNGTKTDPVNGGVNGGGAKGSEDA